MKMKKKILKNGKEKKSVDASVGKKVKIDEKNEEKIVKTEIKKWRKKRWKREKEKRSTGDSNIEKRDDKWKDYNEKKRWKEVR